MSAKEASGDLGLGDRGTGWQVPAPVDPDPGVAAPDPDVRAGREPVQGAGPAAPKDDGGIPVVIGDAVLGRRVPHAVEAIERHVDRDGGPLDPVERGRGDADPVIPLREYDPAVVPAVPGIAVCAGDPVRVLQEVPDNVAAASPAAGRLEDLDPDVGGGRQELVRDPRRVQMAVVDRGEEGIGRDRRDREQPRPEGEAPLPELSAVGSVDGDLIVRVRGDIEGGPAELDGIGRRPDLWCDREVLRVDRRAVLVPQTNVERRGRVDAAGCVVVEVEGDLGGTGEGREERGRPVRGRG